jgi:CheY-like chemotaxis protein
MARILIVDDRAASRELQRIMLESFGHEVAEASGGREAIGTALALNPDLVLLDLVMPGFDGFATLTEFQREPRLASIPVVALTASAMKGDYARILAAGFSAYITKPVFLHSFRYQISRLLESRESNDPRAKRAASS